MYNYWKCLYKGLHIYKHFHMSFRRFKKSSIKRFNDYKKSLKEAYIYVDTDNVKELGINI